MKNVLHLLLITTIVSLTMSCGQDDNKKKELDLKERELALKENELTMKEKDTVTLNTSSNTVSTKNTLPIEKVITKENTFNPSDFLGIWKSKNKNDSPYKLEIYKQNGNYNIEEVLPDGEQPTKYTGYWEAKLEGEKLTSQGGGQMAPIVIKSISANRISVQWLPVIKGENPDIFIKVSK